jgi:hypothetical protein
MRDAAGTAAGSRAATLAAAAILAVAAVARVVAARGELWFDEIWSWAISLEAESALSIFTGLRHDNNHLLNTWILYVLGPDRPDLVYRLPAVAAGVGAVALAGLAARRRPHESIPALALVGFSYFAMHYASEARGYSYAVLFALAAFLLLRTRAASGLAGAAAFAAVSVLGLLSQFSFAYAYAALAVWSVAQALERRLSWLAVARCHTIPVALGAVLYWTRIREMGLGGGPGGGTGEAALQALALAAGGPIGGPAGLAAAALVIAVAAAAAVAVGRERPSDLIPYLGPFVLAVPAALATSRPDFYPRLFLVATVFLLLLFARALGVLAARGRRGRIAVAVLLCLYAGANAVHFERLVRLGRSHYRAVIEHIARGTPGPRLVVGSRHDFRTIWIVRYHADAAGEKALYYLPLEAWPTGGPDWYILHDYVATPAPAPTITDPGGNTYALEAVHVPAGLSGWNTYLYRNERGPGGAPVPEVFRVPSRFSARLTSGGP